jgi:hypothetical protein
MAQGDALRRRSGRIRTSVDPPAQPQLPLQARQDSCGWQNPTKRLRGEWRRKSVLPF